MAYNPYSAINAIYKLKGQWDNASTAGDTTAKNNAATKAQSYYQQLRSNGRGNIADELMASNYAQAKSINDKWANVSDTVTGTYKTGVNNPAYNQSIASASNKNDDLFNTIESDHNNVNTKYDGVYNYANQDVTQTDEYKSAFKNLMPAYTLEAMQGRENEVASGAAANGGNIDSFAAANALRQQTALTAKGQQLAHQAGMDAYNARVQRVQGILESLGGYHTSVYSAMNSSISNDANIANSTFDNEQTSMNNEAARQDVYSGITGTVSDKVTKMMNSNIWNADGSLKANNVDGGYQTNINELEKALAVTTDSNEKSRITEQLRVLEAARNQKIDEQGLTYGKTYKYQSRPATYTANNDAANRTSAENMTKSDNQTKTEVAEKEANAVITQANIEAESDQNKITAEAQAKKELMEYEALLKSRGGVGAYQLTEDEIGIAKQVVSNINTKLKRHTSNTDERDIITPNGGQSFILDLPSNAPKARSWRWEIIPAIFSSGLSADAAVEVALGMGFTGDEILEVTGNNGNE